MKLSRHALRRLIESVINEEDFKDPSMEESEEIVRIGVMAVDKLLKKGGFHPEASAFPANQKTDERINWLVKCSPGSEDMIASYLKENEQEILDFYASINRPLMPIEIYFEPEGSGRINVSVAMYD